MKTFDIHTNTDEFQDFMYSKAWLGPHEKIQTIEKPGEGNMNVVLRIASNQRSYIFKQSRPYVQKYQQIAAPLDRIDVEYQFYSAIQGKQIDDHIPKILGYDPNNYVLLIEDLGKCQDMTAIYESREVSPIQLQQMIQVLENIHQTHPPRQFPHNMDLRELNHQHIFVLPFLEDNGFQLDDIQTGLQELSLSFKQDDHLKAVVKDLGNKYLSKGNTLLHGDYYPGSWMQAGDHIFVIDPEFSFVGFAEFDLGVMAAHLIMASMKEELLENILQSYSIPHQELLVRQMAGLEILRRIIGLAQLPLSRTLEEKVYLLSIAKKLLLE